MSSQPESKFADDLFADDLLIWVLSGSVSASAG